MSTEKRNTYASFDEINFEDVAVGTATAHADVDAILIANDGNNMLLAQEELPAKKTLKGKLAQAFIFVRYPKQVWFIMGNELCERFSFYGFKAILALYLKNSLNFGPDKATTVVHSFIFFAYAMPLFGGWLADSVLGKFWTIFLLSIVYCLGNAVVAVTAIPGVTGTPPHWWGVALGLLLIGIGTGGIKPCVSSFGGDQFAANESELLTSFFSLFYLSINLGSTVSTFVTPIIRDQYGYAAAFAVPAVLLVIATILFVLGKRWYRVVPPGGNVFKVLVGVIWTAIKERRRGKSVRVNHWLDRAQTKYSRVAIEDVKCVLSVTRCLMPLIIFWSLYDQHSTRFVFQAEQMDLRLGKWKLTADQIPILNPLMLITLIPVFDRIVYPLIAKCGIDFKPLRKMTVGFLLTVISFIMAGLLQLAADKYPGKVHVAWQLPQYFLLAFGEIMVSITGLEFAYSQAPKSMKGVMQSFYLLTTAVGNVIVAVVAAISSEAHLMPQAYEFFFFAGLMLLFTALFVLIVRNYKYRDVNKDDLVDDANAKNAASSGGNNVVDMPPSPVLVIEDD